MSASIPMNSVSSNGVGVFSDAQANTWVQTCQTAAQLRAFVGNSGMAVELQGIASPGDGFGGLFYWENGNAFTDNNSTVIVPPAAEGQGAWLWSPTATAWQGPVVTSVGGGLTVTVGGELEIAQSGVTAGTYGASAVIPVITVNAEGLITHVGTAVPSSSTWNGGTVGVLSNQFTINAGTTLEIANSGVTAGAYGNATTIPEVTVGADGRITALNTVAISGTSGNWTSEVDISGAHTIAAGDFGKVFCSTGSGTYNMVFTGVSGVSGAVVGFMVADTSSINLVDTGGFSGSFGGASPINLPTGATGSVTWNNHLSKWWVSYAVANGGTPGGGGGGGGSCFLAWALVTMADGTERPISQIVAGDWVMGRDGEANPVWAQEPVLLEDRPMIVINSEHWTTEDHPYWTSRGPCCFKPEELGKDWGHYHGVITHAGIELWLNVGLTREVKPLIRGAALHWRGTFKRLQSTEEVWLPPDTPLFNLVVGGSHTMRVDGYCVTAWPREDDFCYDDWTPKRVASMPEVAERVMT